MDTDEHGKNRMPKAESRPALEAGPDIIPLCGILGFDFRISDFED
jgi:hypothetical protein